jgi:hypothetical protein
MTKQNVVASTAANLLFDRQREPVLPEVVRAKTCGIDKSGAWGFKREALKTSTPASDFFYSGRPIASLPDQTQH